MPARPLVVVAAATAGVTAVVGGTLAFRFRRHRRGPATVAPRHRVEVPAAPAGSGISLVVNPGGGSADDEVLDALRAGLPAASIVALGEGEDLVEALHAAAGPGTAILGIAGGDGSVNAAACVAAELGLPLLVVPAGTLNHLAVDLGLSDVATAIAAAQGGSGVEVDLARIGERTFLNTASFGSYAELVDAREQLEDRIGKWPAVLVAGWRVLRRHEPIRVDLDGVPHRLWMVFLGNGRYEPQGFAPSHRPRLDDGRLDIRCITADHPGARIRLVLGLLTGRLGRSPVYSERTATRLHVRALDGPLRLACDGETFDGPAEVDVVKDGSRIVLLAAPEVAGTSPATGSAAPTVSSSPAAQPSIS